MQACPRSLELFSFLQKNELFQKYYNFKNTTVDRCLKDKKVMLIKQIKPRVLLHYLFGNIL